MSPEPSRAPHATTSPSLADGPDEHWTPPAQPEGATAVLVLADGTVFWGNGLGAEGKAVGEICFNTSMTGYQEILTDPSYAGQIINFTFPHIGNVGANHEDIEAATPFARGLVVATDVTEPANWRATRHFDHWLAEWGLVGLSGVDTRRLTRVIRDRGAPHGVIAHAADGIFDLAALREEALGWAGLEGMDLAMEVSARHTSSWAQTRWRHGEGYGARDGGPGDGGLDEAGVEPAPALRVVAIDYGAKHNILRALSSAGCEVILVPADATAEDILRHAPDGVFLSNGPGDPAATGAHAVPTIQALMATGTPMFGICLGHQLLALALGGKTVKMPRGHRGGNHPVKELGTGRVEITSQNHGFAVVPESLPDSVEITHVSLFDGTNEGFRVKELPVFSVQYHPEASPGPQDSHHLFHRFVASMAARKAVSPE